MGAFEKEKHGFGKLQLCAMSPKCRGISSTSIFSLRFHSVLLELVGNGQLNLE